MRVRVRVTVRLKHGGSEETGAETSVRPETADPSADPAGAAAAGVFHAAQGKPDTHTHSHQYICIQT